MRRQVPFASPKGEGRALLRKGALHAQEQAFTEDSERMAPEPGSWSRMLASWELPAARQRGLCGPLRPRQHLHVSYLLPGACLSPDPCQPERRRRGHRLRSLTHHPAHLPRRQGVTGLHETAADPVLRTHSKHILSHRRVKRVRRGGRCTWSRNLAESFLVESGDIYPNRVAQRVSAGSTGLLCAAEGAQRDGGGTR